MVGLALFVMFAFGAFAATSAFAEGKLLLNGEAILALLNIEASGELLLKDTKVTGPPEIVCAGIFDVDVEPGGVLGFVEALLTSTKELLEGATAGSDLIECKKDLKNLCSTPVDVEVLSLPGHVEIELMLVGTASVYLLIFLEEAEKTPHYIVHCKTILGEMEDLCEGLSSARLNNTAEDVLGYFNALAITEPFGAATETAACSLGGAASGVFESITKEGAELDVEASGGLIAPVGGGLLQVSE